MAYQKNVDYQDLINKAVAAGDYNAAANYERVRNEKIAALDSSGTNKYGATATNNYSQHLGNGSGTNIYTWDDNQANQVAKANQNSMDWWGADETGRKVLEEANRQIYANLGSGIAYDSRTGTWSGVADQPISVQTGVNPMLPSFDVSSLGSRPSFSIDEYLGTNPKPTYESQYSQRIDALLDDILNREKFSYDVESDPLYQQYRSQYLREGNRAMNDTLAAAASGAGGMNSYAMTAAQQANDYYNAQLNDRIPELYQLAYEMYLNNIDGQVRDMGLLEELDNTQYGRYQDTMNEWYSDRDFAYGAYRDDVGDWENDRDFAYGQYRDDMSDYWTGMDFNYRAEQDNIANDQWQQSFDHGVSQDAIDNKYRQDVFDYDVTQDEKEWAFTENKTAYDRAMDLLLQGVMPNATLLANAGISEAEAKALMAKVNEVGTVSTGGGSGDDYDGGDDYDADDDDDEYEPTPVKRNPVNKRPTAERLPDDNPELADENAEVYNRHGDDWVEIPGHGRYTWVEVEAMVDKGQVEEVRTADGKLKYSWVDKPKATGGGNLGGRQEYLMY